MAGAAPTGQPVLEVAGLHVTFSSTSRQPAVHAVRGVGYHVHRGEVLGIVGESGSGKTAAALAVMGLLPGRAEATGSVRLHGEELLGLGDREMARKRGKSVALVAQDALSALTPVYTVGEQIAEAVRTHDRGISRAGARARAVELLDLVRIPSPQRRYAAFPHEFSGGMRQRVMIAMAMAHEPDVLIADEPTTALDATVRAQVLELLEAARRDTGAAMVLITHDLGVVAGHADRVVVMYAGRAVEEGPVDDIYRRPRMPYTMGMLDSVPRPDAAGPLTAIPPPVRPALPPGCPFAARCPAEIAQCSEAEPPLLAVGTGGHAVACVRAQEIEERGWTAADIYPVPEIPPAPEGAHRSQRRTVLRTEGLVKHYRMRASALPWYRRFRPPAPVRVVAGVSLDIAEGETLGVVGESGCGKTSTLLEILNLAAPDGGRVEVLGRDTGTLAARERFELRRGIQVVFQDPMASLDPRMPVFDLVAEPLRTHTRPSAAGLRSRVAELLRLVGLEPGHAGRYPAELSGGMRQRVAIARAIALEPRLLLLDEPVSALDVSVQAGVIGLLADLKARFGLSYLIVSHDLAVVRHIADRVCVMHLGVIVEAGDAKAVFSAPAHPYTAALLSAVPVPDPAKERDRTRIVLDGDPPSPADPPSGCRFRTRCPRLSTLTESQRELCREREPQLEPVPGTGHTAACHYVPTPGMRRDQRHTR